MDEKTEPIEISLIWYESDKEQVKPYLEIFQKELTRNPDAPFSRELHLPLYFFELHKGEKFPEIKIDGQKAIAFIFTSIVAYLFGLMAYLLCSLFVSI